MIFSDFLAEFNSMKQLRHPYLVKLHGANFDVSEPFILMDYHENQSVLYFLKNGKLFPNIESVEVIIL